MSATATTASKPRVAVVNDFEMVVAGVAAMLEPFAGQVDVVDTFTIDETTDETTDDCIDLALFDMFGRDHEVEPLTDLLSRDGINAVAIYSFNFDERAVDRALRAGASGYLSKALPAEDLVGQIVRIAAGECVTSVPGTTRRPPTSSRCWPGQDIGLSEREAEVVALAAIGKRNTEIADCLYLSVDTVKTHLARSFRKLDVHNRTELAAMIHRRPSFRRLLPEG